MLPRFRRFVRPSQSSDPQTSSPQSPVVPTIVFRPRVVRQPMWTNRQTAWRESIDRLSKAQAQFETECRRRDLPLRYFKSGDSEWLTVEGVRSRPDHRINAEWLAFAYASDRLSTAGAALSLIDPLGNAELHEAMAGPILTHGRLEAAASNEWSDTKVPSDAQLRKSFEQRQSQQAVTVERAWSAFHVKSRHSVTPEADLLEIMGWALDGATAAMNVPQIYVVDRSDYSTFKKQRVAVKPWSVVRVDEPLFVAFRPDVAIAANNRVGADAPRSAALLMLPNGAAGELLSEPSLPEGSDSDAWQRLTTEGTDSFDSMAEYLALASVARTRGRVKEILDCEPGTWREAQDLLAGPQSKSREASSGDDSLGII